MAEDAQTRTKDESRRVVSLIAGAIVFYICIAVVTAVDQFGSSASSSISMGVWPLGAGLSSAFGVGVAKRITPDFNRIGLILLMVAPIVLFAVAVFFAAGDFSDRTIENVLLALLGTAIGLGITFSDLMKSSKTKPATRNPSL